VWRFDPKRRSPKDQHNRAPELERDADDGWRRRHGERVDGDHACAIDGDRPAPGLWLDAGSARSHGGSAARGLTGDLLTAHRAATRPRRRP